VRKRVTKDSSAPRGKRKAAAGKARAIKPAAKASPQQAVEVKRGHSPPTRSAAAARKPKGATGAKVAAPRRPASPAPVAAASEVLAAAAVVARDPTPPPISPRSKTVPPEARAAEPKPKALRSNGADLAATTSLIVTPQPTPPATQPPPSRLAAPVATAKPPATPFPDVQALSRNIARFVEEGQNVLAAYIKPLETGEAKVGRGEEVAEMVTTLGRVAEYYGADPQRAYHAQSTLSKQFVDLWTTTLQRLNGVEAPPVVALDAGDKRFADPEWQANPYFDFIKQAYVLTTRWAQDLVKRADDLDPHTRDKAAFYLKQVTSALSPSNFLATNPELLRTTLAESGDNLVRGLHMFAEDIEAGHGNLRIRQSDAAKFKLGVNMAVTPGQVIFRNELMELIQYAPSTPDVYRRPLLIVPPWINKFYILDLNPEKSFIRWAVAQGLTVFVVSWVNPDERHADKGFEAYMREGIFAALDAIEAATGERDVAAIGYCVGGTLLAVTLAFMAEIKDTRISSATFFTTQVDFKDAGDLKLFVDAEQLKTVESKMAGTGYLDGAEMATAFNMLRPNDLIWSYWVNNYLKGKEPMAFDLLVWNADSTRMPAANHRFYLRHFYLQNDLTEGRMAIEGKTINLKNVTIPIYDLATKEDHIAPARSVFNGAEFFGGPVRYVMSGSGHIAGVVNPPDKVKYQYWTGPQPEGAFADWLAAAKETPGSWWPDWIAWLTAQAPARVPAREPGAGKLKPLGDAPGEYVKVRV